MVLITGATGLVGANILLELALKDKKIRALKRPTSSLKKVKNLFEKHNQITLWNTIEWADGDITDITSLDTVFKDIQEVYHLAGLVDFDDRKSKELYTVNVKGTANLINFSIAHHVKNFLYCSSISVMDLVNNEKITEKSEFLSKKPHSKYACSKFSGEMEVWRGSQEGLNVVIVNPGVILGGGFENQSSGEIFKKAAKGYYSSGGTGFISVEDVAQCCFRLMEEKHFNERYILVSENISYQNFVQEICNSKKVKTRKISNRTLKLIKTLSSILYFLGFKGFLSPSNYESLTTSTIYDNKKILKTLDYTFEPIVKTLNRINY